MSERISSLPEYDVCIVGSGAAGGVAAKVLTEGGLNTVLLEAGSLIDPEKDFKQHSWPYEFPRRGAGFAGIGSSLMAPNGFWNHPLEPYTRDKDTKFNWFRSRAVGGRTNMWGRAVYRFSEADFRPRSSDGAGEDWPITYQDVAPYYDKVESFIGVFGSRENIPSVPDGIFLPPPPPRCTERLLQRGCGKLNIPCVPSRVAVLTRPLNGRPACHYCGQCGFGCKVGANFTSTQVMIAPALRSGRLTLIADAMAREIIVDKQGRAKAISYIDKITGAERQICSKTIVLAASSCETARLLLNSRSSLFPQGLANSSGAVGRYLTDTLGSDGEGYFPELAKMAPHNHDGTSGMHLFIPWWKFNRKNDFLRGYQIEFGGGRTLPCIGLFYNVCKREEGYGIALKEKCRQQYGTSIYFSGRGEMIPNDLSYCEIDPEIVDEWGIPVLKFRFGWGENERRMAKDIQDTLRAIVEAAGGQYMTRAENHSATMSTGGMNYHELGTARMGNNPNSSVVNRFCQSHEIKNLFVVDGACFVSHPGKPPTLTIMALAWRASEYLLEEARNGL